MRSGRGNKSNSRRRRASQDDNDDTIPRHGLETGAGMDDGSSDDESEILTSSDDEGEWSSDEDDSRSSDDNTPVSRTSASRSSLASASLSASSSSAPRSKRSSSSRADAAVATGGGSAEISAAASLMKAHADDLSSDDEAPKNTRGNVPKEWYEGMGHVGYDVAGRRIARRNRPDGVERFLESQDNPLFKWTIYDSDNDEEITLSKGDVEVLRNIVRGKYGHTSAQHDEDLTGIFSKDKEIHPLDSAPEPKRRFLPSKWMTRRINRMAQLIKAGKFRSSKSNDAEDDVREQVYALWGDDGTAIDQDMDTAVGGSKRPPPIAPPKPAPPGHALSYNPPEEYLFTAEEKEAWESMEPKERPVDVEPAKFAALRHVPAYESLAKERFERCLDLYLAPRLVHQRQLPENPESLLPQLPDPKELRPFPTGRSIEYSGHEGRVRGMSVSPSGEWLATCSDDGTVRVWEVETGREMRRWTLCDEPIVSDVSWCPKADVHIIAAVAGTRMFLLYPGTAGPSQLPITFRALAGLRAEEGLRSKVVPFEVVSEAERAGQDKRGQGAGAAAAAAAGGAGDGGDLLGPVSALAALGQGAAGTGALPRLPGREEEEGEEDSAAATAGKTTGRAGDPAFGTGAAGAGPDGFDTVLQPEGDAPDSEGEEYDEGQEGKDVPAARRKFARWRWRGLQSELDFAEEVSHSAAGIKVEVVMHYKQQRVVWHRNGDYLATVAPSAPATAAMVLVHQLSRRKSLNPMKKNQGLVQCVAFHPRKPRIFVANQRAVRVYDMMNEKQLARMHTGCKWIASMEVHPTGDHLLLTAYDRKVVWLDLVVPSRDPFKTLRYHTKAVRDCSFHGHYPLLATCSDDGSTHVYHARVTEGGAKPPVLVPVKILRSHQKDKEGLGVLGCAFHPQQPWLFTSGADRVVVLHQDYH